MAKKKDAGGVPAWMITFSDLMTLLLTFFVLLLSMAALMDERKRRVVLGSIIGSFGIGEQGVDALTTEGKAQMVEPGPIEDSQDLAFVRPMLWDDKAQDLDFESNRFIQIVSINADFLFQPGSWELTPRGADALDRLLPGLLDIAHPLLLAGHSGILRDELGGSYRAAGSEEQLLQDWRISLYRTLTVYKYLLDGGMDPEKLRMEAFGSNRPRTTNKTPEGRKSNRRVEIILDKRISDWDHRIDPYADEQVEADSFRFRDFIFKLR